MHAPRPATWLATQLKQGVTDLPTNVGWIASRAVGRSSPEGTEARIRRADEAFARAHDSETIARDRAQRAKDLADELDRLRAVDAYELEATRRRLDKDVERTIKEAQAEADEFVAAKKAKVEELAQEEIAAAEAAARKRAEEAAEEARKAREDAERAVAEAREQMAEARRLAEEAEEAAREAAEHAAEQARHLSGANGSIPQVSATGATDLTAMTKADLVALGQDLGLDLKATDRKDDLVKAIQRSPNSMKKGNG